MANSFDRGNWGCAKGSYRFVAYLSRSYLRKIKEYMWFSRPLVMTR